ncbi:MAG: glycosyltransferase family 2 protein [Promethearchaeota archaeon]
MKISVIMSVHNSEKFVSKAIESILNQTFKDFEFIIIDDGSIDNSYEITKKYLEIDKRVKLIRNKLNLGLTKSLNKGLKLSKGKYIARQDADDISLTNRLERQLMFLQSNPEYAFCGCNGTLKRSGNEIVKFFDYKALKKHQIKENCITHPTIMIKKDIFEKYGYYNEKLTYGQDFELWCRLIYKYRIKGKNLSEKLYIFDVPPIVSVLKKNKRKLIIQQKNGLFSVFKYFKYLDNKLIGVKSILNFLFTIALYLILPKKFCSFLIND